MSDAAADGRPSPTGGTASGRRALALAGMGFALIVGLLFADVWWVADGVTMPSHPQGDGARYFAWQRLFAYSEIAGGNWPLWNPHTFSGAPCVGIFQSAIFYPLNLVHLLVPVRTGIVIELALHLLLLALFTFAWLRDKAITPISAFLAALTVVLGATCSLRVLAGQLSVLETYAWWPLLLLAVDRLARRPALGWLLAGVGAASLMILAGHPPTVLMAGFATALYCVPYLFSSSSSSSARWRFVGCLLVVASAPALLTAAQLWPGLHTAAEGLRAGGMSFAFSTSHSFPPEQLLTLLAPEAFGNASLFHRSYFGRVFFWDATLYIGVIGLLLAFHGATTARGRHRNVALVLAPLLCVVAMGGYTPVYALLHAGVPGLAYIRAPSKFLFFAVMFAAVLIGQGLDRLGADRRGLSRTIALALCLGGLLATAAIWAWISDPQSATSISPWSILGGIAGAADFEARGELADWRALMLRSFASSAGVALVAVPLLAFASRSRRGVALLVVVAAIELFVFARANRGTTPVTIELDLRPRLVEAYRLAEGTRVIETAAPSNIAIAQRDFAIWGYDPVVLGRYLEFIARTQGLRMSELDNPTRLAPERHHPLHAMLRARLQVMWRTNELVDHPGALPRFLLLGDYRVVSGPDAALDAVFEPGFDPRRTLILESEPVPAPAAGSSRAARIFVLDQSTDHIEIELEIPEPRILLMTDAYSRGWRALALPGSDQDTYALLPANHVLRAVPLAAGHHRLRIEYSPLAWRAGARVSALSLAVFVGLASFAAARALRPSILADPAARRSP